MLGCVVLGTEDVVVVVCVRSGTDVEFFFVTSGNNLNEMVVVRVISGTDMVATHSEADDSDVSVRHPETDLMSTQPRTVTRALRCKL